jgi:hypothetical protein
MFELRRGPRFELSGEARGEGWVEPAGEETGEARAGSKCSS